MVRPEFLLGDIPALTVDHATGAVGVAQGVTADHADEIFMPLAPRLLVTLGPPDGAASSPTTKSTSTTNAKSVRPRTT